MFTAQDCGHTMYMYQVYKHVLRAVGCGTASTAMAVPVFFQPRPNFHIATYLWVEPDSEARHSAQLATVYSENQWLLDH